MKSDIEIRFQAFADSVAKLQSPCITPDEERQIACLEEMHRGKLAESQPYGPTLRKAARQELVSRVESATSAKEIADRSAELAGFDSGADAVWKNLTRQMKALSLEAGSMLLPIYSRELARLSATRVEIAAFDFSDLGLSAGPALAKADQRIALMRHGVSLCERIRAGETNSSPAELAAALGFEFAQACKTHAISFSEVKSSFGPLKGTAAVLDKLNSRFVKEPTPEAVPSAVAGRSSGPERRATVARTGGASAIVEDSAS